MTEPTLITNRDLRLDHLSAREAEVEALFGFAATFDGYGAWGGFLPCAMVANGIQRRWESSGGLPDSITALRGALFFESRRERFVDFGGFGDEPEGWQEHQAYMRELVERIRQRLKAEDVDDEDQVFMGWLRGAAFGSWAPARELDEQEGREASSAVEDGALGAAVSVAARALGVDMKAGAKLNEDRLSDCL